MALVVLVTLLGGTGGGLGLLYHLGLAGGKGGTSLVLSASLSGPGPKASTWAARLRLPQMSRMLMAAASGLRTAWALLWKLTAWVRARCGGQGARDKRAFLQQKAVT